MSSKTVPVVFVNLGPNARRFLESQGIKTKILKKDELKKDEQRK